jgi:hypothetical protein
MAEDPMDRIERMLLRCIEEERRERQLRREQFKAGTLSPGEQRMEELLRQRRKDKREARRRNRSSE